MPLIEYIKLNFSGNQAEFARHMGVPRQKVHEWVSLGWVVVGNAVCSPKRTIPEIGCNE